MSKERSCICILLKQARQLYIDGNASKPRISKMFRKHKKLFHLGDQRKYIALSQGI